jgi:hypothetical protein
MYIENSNISKFDKPSIERTNDNIFITGDSQGPQLHNNFEDISTIVP